MSTDTQFESSGTDGYVFTSTQDWFSFNIDTWTSLFPLVHSPEPRVLEIGSWEGRSAVFLLTELCKSGGSIVCIDHFDLMRTPAGRDRYAKVRHNLSITGKPFRILDEFSFPALVMLLEEEMSAECGSTGYDWIYVDGSHEADDTFLDGELVWRLARKGAVVIFDDYHWDKEPRDSMHHPRRGVDAFMALHRGEYERISDPSQYQMILRKTTDMRIGFLVKERARHGLKDVLGYSMNIVLAVDSRYAMPAAVAIRSIVEHTQGRITIYVVDCGLFSSDIENIKYGVPRDNTTLVFLELPGNSLASDMGACWAKVDLLRVLPVERALYIDADVLVRGDLRELWDTDLRGKEIGAVTDVGHPMGHEGIERRSYFNAGVLLMDLAKMRSRSSELVMVGRRMKEARYKDQDALNCHFAGNWESLDLRWNAQGLGTYATRPCANRQILDVKSMVDAPKIVHFTGPTHPEMAVILDPYNQPYTAKPWGYAGAPGHPYREEWWAMLNHTAWKGLQNSEDWRRGCKEEKERAIRSAVEKLEERVKVTAVI